MKTIRTKAPAPKGNPVMDTQIGGLHYKKLAIQPMVYCQLNKLHACETSVIQYVTRHQDKGGRLDLEKAIHCLQMLIEMEYPQQEAAK